MACSIQTTCLTDLSVSGGCGCKLDPASLQELLSHFKGDQPQRDLILGFDTADDCAVYEYSDEDYLLFTTDFFTPLVNDPRTYGALAAANALSDVYAMGGKPLIANVILGFPPDRISSSDVKEIMRGGQGKMDEVGCFIVGGHTIINPQPVYGFSIIGRVDKKHLKKNNGAREGDLLILTKPLGSGILSNALKLGLLESQLYEELVPWLVSVNSVGYSLGAVPEVSALTDVTGFGLIGHLIEMAQGTGLYAEIDISSIPLFPGTENLCSAVLAPQSGAVKNYNNYQSQVSFHPRSSKDQRYILCDPQSNGGLLIAVEPEGVDKVQSVLKKHTGTLGCQIGSFKRKTTESYYVRTYG